MNAAGAFCCIAAQHAHINKNTKTHTVMNTHIITDEKKIEETFINELNTSEGIIRLNIDDFRNGTNSNPPFALASAEGDQPLCKLISAALEIIAEMRPHALRKVIISIFQKDDTCIMMDEMLSLGDCLDNAFGDTTEYRWSLSTNGSLEPGTKRVSVYAFGKI